VRSKLDKAGFKTYTHVAETKEGPRTRVRVGPFTSRDEADKAARKIKQLQMQPQVLTL
jgi:DedD protein